jgi:ABC-2 type transport system ATP-binding protein
MKKSSQKHRIEEKMIETMGLTKYYGRKKAIESLNMVVEKNSIYGFLGCNGAGKTTTLSILAGAVKKTSGKITIDGRDFDEGIGEIKSITGVMLQNSDIHPNKTCFSNMFYCAMLKGMEKKNALEEINSLFSEFEVEELKNIKAKKLSHGQRKIIMIMQAFLNKPKIVLLDEPISGFDPKRVIMLREFLRKKSKEVAIVVSSHQLDEIDRLCTHLGIIHDGKIIVQGSKDKIKGKKSLEQIFVENM